MQADTHTFPEFSLGNPVGKKVIKEFCLRRHMPTMRNTRVRPAGSRESSRMYIVYNSARAIGLQTGFQRVSFFKRPVWGRMSTVYDHVRAV